MGVVGSNPTPSVFPATPYAPLNPEQTQESGQKKQAPGPTLPRPVASQVARAGRLDVLQELSSPDPKVKYGAAKALLDTAKADPASLYPHFEFFAGLLASGNNILKWTAIDIVGFLSSVDSGKKVPRILPQLFVLLNCGKMITANHAIAALGNIGQSFPEHREAIIGELLKVEHYTYDTDECRNIALGQVLLALGACAADSADKKRLVQFAERQTLNTRPATARKAAALLKKLDAAAVPPE